MNRNAVGLGLALMGVAGVSGQSAAERRIPLLYTSGPHSLPYLVATFGDDTDVSLVPDTVSSYITVNSGCAAFVGGDCDLGACEFCAAETYAGPGSEPIFLAGSTLGGKENGDDLPVSYTNIDSDLGYFGIAPPICFEHGAPEYVLPMAAKDHFSYYLAEEGGVLAFDQYSRDKYCNSLGFFPVDAMSDSWSISFDTVNDVACTRAFLLDTSEPYIYLEPALYNAFIAELSNVEALHNGHTVADCDSSAGLVLTANDVVISLDSSILVVPRAQHEPMDSADKCIVLVKDRDSNILGSPFFHAAYSVFAYDITEPGVYLAQQANCGDNYSGIGNGQGLDNQMGCSETCPAPACIGGACGPSVAVEPTVEGIAEYAPESTNEKTDEAAYETVHMHMSGVHTSTVHPSDPTPEVAETVTITETYYLTTCFAVVCTACAEGTSSTTLTLSTSVTEWVSEDITTHVVSSTVTATITACGDDPNCTYGSMTTDIVSSTTTVAPAEETGTHAPEGEGWTLGEDTEDVPAEVTEEDECEEGDEDCYIEECEEDDEDCYIEECEEEDLISTTTTQTTTTDIKTRVHTEYGDSVMPTPTGPSCGDGGCVVGDVYESTETEYETMTVTVVRCSDSSDYSAGCYGDAVTTTSIVTHTSIHTYSLTYMDTAVPTGTVECDGMDCPMTTAASTTTGFCDSNGIGCQDGDVYETVYTYTTTMTVVACADGSEPTAGSCYGDAVTSTVTQTYTHTYTITYPDIPTETAAPGCGGTDCDMTTPSCGARGSESGCEDGEVYESTATETSTMTVVGCDGHEYGGICYGEEDTSIVIETYTHTYTFTHAAETTTATSMATGVACDGADGADCPMATAAPTTTGFCDSNGIGCQDGDVYETVYTYTTTLTQVVCANGAAPASDGSCYGDVVTDIVTQTYTHTYTVTYPNVIPTETAAPTPAPECGGAECQDGDVYESTEIGTSTMTVVGCADGSDYSYGCAGEEVTSTMTETYTRTHTYTHAVETATVIPTPIGCGDDEDCETETTTETSTSTQTVVSCADGSEPDASGECYYDDEVTSTITATYTRTYTYTHAAETAMVTEVVGCGGVDCEDGEVYESIETETKVMTVITCADGSEYGSYMDGCYGEEITSTMTATYRRTYTFTHTAETAMVTAVAACEGAECEYYETSISTSTMTLVGCADGSQPDTSGECYYDDEVTSTITATYTRTYTFTHSASTKTASMTMGNSGMGGCSPEDPTCTATTTHVKTVTRTATHMADETGAGCTGAGCGSVEDGYGSNYDHGHGYPAGYGSGSGSSGSEAGAPGYSKGEGVGVYGSSINTKSANSGIGGAMSSGTPVIPSCGDGKGMVACESASSSAFFPASTGYAGTAYQAHGYYPGPTYPQTNTTTPTVPKGAVFSASAVIKPQGMSTVIKLVPIATDTPSSYGSASPSGSVVGSSAASPSREVTGNNAVGGQQSWNTTTVSAAILECGMPGMEPCDVIVEVVPVAAEECGDIEAGQPGCAEEVEEIDCSIEGMEGGEGCEAPLAIGCSMEGIEGMEGCEAEDKYVLVGAAGRSTFANGVVLSVVVGVAAFLI